MMKPMKALIAYAVVVLMSGVLAACQKNESRADAAQKGPAEEVGQKLDQAAAKAAVEINKAAEQAGKGLQKAGESLQSKANEAQSKEEQK